MRSSFVLLATVALALSAAAQGVQLDAFDRGFPRFGDTADLALGDVDGDGDVDAVVATTAGAYAVRRTANGSFDVDGAPLADTDLFEGLGQVRLFDADGDTDLDLYLGRFGTQKLFVNDGAGAFADASQLLPAVTIGPADVAVDDVDGDGDLDLLLVYGSSTGALWRNQGAAGFVQEAAPGMFSRNVALADVDGDGDPDMIHAQEGFCDPFGCFTGFTNLELNDGTGSFSAVPFPSSATWATELDVGDLNQDGDLDVVVACDESIPSLLFRNEGGLLFVDVSTFLPAVPEDGKGVELLDVEGDGDLDLFFSGTDGFDGLDEVLIVQAPGTFVDESFRLPPGACCGAGRADSADVDGDGDPDLVVRGVTPRVLVQDAGATFVDAAPQSVVEGGRSDETALGDLDGDGAADGLRLDGHFLHRLSNDGDGGLTVAQIDSFVPPPSTWRIDMADVDGDGDLDGLVTASGNWLYANDGAGNLTRSALPGTLSKGLRAFDADGDGDLDAAMVGVDNALLQNDGAGAFTEAPESFFPDGTVDSRDAAPADYDLDGDLDLVFVEGQGWLYENGGAAGWTIAPTRLPPVALARRADGGDVDGDGFPDVLVGKIISDNVVLLGDGAGGFATSAYLPATGAAPKAILADLDEDGDLDAVTDRVWENTGAAFVDASLPGLEFPLVLEPADVGDLDGDGDLDVLFDGARLLRNGLRQTSWRTLAGLGRPLEMEVAGEAGTAWNLAWSLSTAEIDTSFGLLKLAPGSLSVGAVGLFGPDGRATVSGNVPASPGLVGVAVHWQSLLGNPLRLTNRTSTALFDL